MIQVETLSGSINLWLPDFQKTRNYAKRTSKQKGKQKREEIGKERANKMASLFENCFRSGGEENERQMVNNVMQEMRVL